MKQSQQKIPNDGKNLRKKINNLVEMDLKEKKPHTRYNRTFCFYLLL